MENVTFEKLLKWIIGVLVFIIVVLIIVNSSTSARNFVKSLGGLLKSNDVSTENKYFAAHEMGFLNDKQIVDTPPECTRIATTITCPKGTAVAFYVRIENLGSVERDFYPVPQLGKECKNNADCKTFDAIESSEPCTVQPGVDMIRDCKANSKYIFDEKGTFRVFSGARCSYDDCPEGSRKQGNNVYIYNNAQYFNFIITEFP